MIRIRVIPSLLLKDKGLVKTIQFKNEVYVGDPINAIKIFNDKEVDELAFFDIAATKEGRKPDYGYIEKLAGECFMPFSYGGGVTKIEDIKMLNRIGVEKVVISSEAVINPGFIREAVDKYGSSSIVVCLDIKKNFWGKYEVYTHSGSKKGKINAEEMIDKMNEANVGELIINSIDKDGMMKGYDTELLRMVTSKVSMPVVALGGAGNVTHFKEAADAGVSAVAAGSMFVFYGPHKAVLINYPKREELIILD